MYKEKIDSSKSISRQLPVNITDKDRYLFEHELLHQLPERLVIAASEVILSNGYWVTNNQGDLLTAFSMNYHNPGLVSKLKKKIDIILGNNIILDDEYYWVIDSWSGGYFHWISDSLPRLLCLIEHYGPGTVILPSKFKHIPFIMDSIWVFDCPVLFFDEQKSYCIKKLITHSYLADTGNYHPEIISKLAEKIKKKLPDNESPINKQKLYISREKATKRKVTNEEEVRSMFKKYGFKVVHMEDYTFKEQVELLSKAQIVASIHGAGLTNMIFMPEGSRVLEFRKKNDKINNCFFSLASACKINYYYIEDINTLTSIDMQIDLVSLTGVLDKIVS